MSLIFRSEEWRQAWKATYLKRFNQLVTFSRLPEFYSHASQTNLFKITTLSLVGVQIPSSGVVRSEYNDFSELLALDSHRLRALRKTPWVRLWLPDALAETLDEQKLNHLARQLNANLRRVGSEPSYVISADSIDSYKKNLSYSARRKYFNNKARLEREGKISFRFADIENLQSRELFFNALNRFMIERWGRVGLDTDDVDFFVELHSRLKLNGGGLVLSELYFGGEFVSAILDIEYVTGSGKVEVTNMQLTHRSHRLAFGALHLGHRIEQCISLGRTYFLLAGTGKFTDYKKSLATRKDTLVTYQLERGHYKLLNKLRDWLAKR